MPRLWLPSPGIPSYGQGFAPRDGPPAYPAEHDGLELLLDMTLGPTGDVVHNWSPHRDARQGELTNMDPASDWVVGRYGWALDFDGSNDYLTCGDLSAAEDQTFTYFAVINSTQSGADKYFLCEGNSGSDTPCCGLLLNNNVLRCYWRQDNNSSVNVLGSITINDGAWHLVAAVGDGTNLTLYVDGEADGADAFPALVAQTINVSSVGCLLRTSPGYYFAGQIALVGVSGRAWTASEIQQLYVDAHALTRLKRQVSLATAADTMLERSYPRGVCRGVVRGAA